MKDHNSLEAVLLESQSRGYLGDQPVARQIEHSLGFADVCTAATPLMEGQLFSSTSDPARGVIQLLDLGAGGGIPGLVLALSGVLSSVERFRLLEGSSRRGEWLSRAVEILGLASYVDVVCERAELAGRDPALRSSVSIVVARSFGRPAVTAECAAPFLDVGGLLVVSEPPSTAGLQEDQSGGLIPGARRIGHSVELESRWPREGLRALGYGPACEWRARGFRYAVSQLQLSCRDRFPRRNGIPAKRPLF